MKRILGACFCGLLIAAACGGSGETNTTGAGGSAGTGGGGSGGSKGGSGGSNSSGGSSAGRGGSNAGGTNAGGANSGGSGGAVPPADAPFACGAETCGVNQFCVNPCCGGAPLPCFQIADGGTCPEGSTPGCTFPSGQCSIPTNCCQPGPCEPPPPYCADEPPIGCFLQGRSCLMLCA